MRKIDYVSISIFVLLLSIGLLLTIEGRMLGENTGKIGGVVSVIGFIEYAIWFAWRTNQNVAKADASFYEYLRPLPSSSVFPHDTEDLAGSQKEILRRLERNHWLFVTQYVGNLITVPSIAIWAFLFIFAAQPEFDRFLIESAMIGIPFLLTIVIFWIQGRLFFHYFRITRQYLRDTRRAVETGQGDVDITTYINLLFNVLRVNVGSTDSPHQKQVDQVRNYLRVLKYLPIIELVVLISVTVTMGLLFGTMGQYITASFLNMVLFYSFYGIVAAMGIRFILFIAWRKLIAKWLKLYSALGDWQDNLEKTFLGNEGSTQLGE